MACGTAVVSVNCPYGPGEIISDGVNGLLVPENDEATLANAIIKLMKEEQLRKKISEAGERRAQDFLVEKIVAEYMEIFERFSEQ